ncbi:MAG TPA: ABC transporter permease subunit [Vicinamibacterales bacterium]|nr:ABC transporter permease subunit [Vicinamibacterales bacterium]
MIEIRGVSKRFGARAALSEVTLTLRPGEITLLLGANGAGKSTLLRCLLGLTAFDGEIHVRGLDPLTSGRDVRALIGYMPQSGGLHPDLTVAQTMAFYAGIRKAPPARVALLLHEAGLSREIGTRVGDLSGGTRQRLGFALALLTDPEILILDEPSSSLDAASREWLASRLQALAAEGRTVVVSTHAGQELFDAADRRVMLEEGRVVVSEAGHGGAQSPPRRRANPYRSGGQPAAGAIAPIVRKEWLDALRSRWLIGYAVLLGVLGLAATAAALDDASGLTVQAFGRTTATLMNLCLLLAPLVAILTSAASIAGEQERGTLEPLLAQPLTRSKLLLGKHAGVLFAIAAATLAGFLPAGVVIARNGGAVMLGHYLLFPLLAILAAAAMSAIGLLISVTSRSAVQAQGAAVVVWFSLALLYDLVMIGSLAVSGLPAPWLVASLLANPIDAARVLGVLMLEPDLYLLGPAGAFLSASVAPAGAAALLLAAITAWAIVPLLAATFAFSVPLRRKKSHDSNRVIARRRHDRPRRDDRVHVRG